MVKKDFFFFCKYFTNWTNFLGVGSNLVGIQTSRMSTFLHASAPKGQLPASNPTYLVSPWFAFFSKGILFLQIEIKLTNLLVYRYSCSYGPIINVDYYSSPFILYDHIVLSSKYF